MKPETYIFKNGDHKKIKEYNGNKHLWFTGKLKDYHLIVMVKG